MMEESFMLQLRGKVVGVDWDDYYELGSITLWYEDGKEITIQASETMVDQYSSMPMLTMEVKNSGR